MPRAKSPLTLPTSLRRSSRPAATRSAGCNLRFIYNQGFIRSLLSKRRPIISGVVLFLLPQHAPPLRTRFVLCPNSASAPALIACGLPCCGAVCPVYSSRIRPPCGKCYSCVLYHCQSRQIVARLSLLPSYLHVVGSLGRRSKCGFGDKSGRLMQVMLRAMMPSLTKMIRSCIAGYGVVRPSMPANAMQV